MIIEAVFDIKGSLFYVLVIKLPPEYSFKRGKKINFHITLKFFQKLNF